MSAIKINPKNIYKINNNKIVDNKIDNVQITEPLINQTNTSTYIDIILYENHEEELTKSLVQSRNYVDVFEVYNLNERYYDSDYFIKTQIIKCGTLVRADNYTKSISATLSDTSLGYQMGNEEYVESNTTGRALDCDVISITYDEFLNTTPSAFTPRCVYIITDKCTDNSIYFGFNVISYSDFLHKEWWNKRTFTLNISINTKETRVYTYTNGDKKLRIDSNNLLTNNTSFEKQGLLLPILLPMGGRIEKTIVNDYKNGKELATIDVDIGEYYDKNNVLAISTKDDSLPMLFKNGDIVVPYVRTSKIVNNNIEYGEEPLSGTIANPKEFIVIGTETFNKGYCGQRLTIREK